MNTFFNRLYLVKCFKNFKALFCVTLVLFAGIIYTHKTKIELTPFFYFGAYSGKISIQKGSFFSLRINNNQQLNFPHTFDEPRRMMIFSTLDTYNKGVLNNGVDPSKLNTENIAQKHSFLTPFQKFAYCSNEVYNTYLVWLKKYLQSSVDANIKKVEIFENYIHFDNSNIPTLDSSVLKYQID